MNVGSDSHGTALQDHAMRCVIYCGYPSWIPSLPASCPADFQDQSVAGRRSAPRAGGTSGCHYSYAYVAVGPIAFLLPYQTPYQISTARSPLTRATTVTLNVDRRLKPRPNAEHQLGIVNSLPFAFRKIGSVAVLPGPIHADIRRKFTPDFVAKTQA